MLLLQMDVELAYYNLTLRELLDMGGLAACGAPPAACPPRLPPVPRLACRPGPDASSPPSPASLLSSACSPAFSPLLLLCPGKEIHWIEWGIGGGATNNGDTPAATALEAAYYPYWGVWGAYNVSRDPWQTPAVRDYMRHYIQQTSSYLLQVR